MADDAAQPASPRSDDDGKDVVEYRFRVEIVVGAPPAKGVDEAYVRRLVDDEIQRLGCAIKQVAPRR